jgi:hypothetical protein
MMRSNRRIRLLALMTAALVSGGLASAIPVHADEPAYAWMHCEPAYDSRLTLAVRGPGVGDDYRVDGVAAVEPCRAPAPNEVFAVAIYSPNPSSAIVPIRVRTVGYAHYVDVPSGTAAEGQFEITPDVHAACLVSEATVRLSCFAITWTRSTRGVLVPSIGDAVSPGDPRVRAAASLPDRGGACPACWWT